MVSFNIIIFLPCSALHSITVLLYSSSFAYLSVKTLKQSTHTRVVMIQTDVSSHLAIPLYRALILEEYFQVILEYFSFLIQVMVMLSYLYVLRKGMLSQLFQKTNTYR